MDEAGKLYVVATPIGNLSDLSARALQVLAQVEIVAAEDTRVSSNLLAQHGIHAKLVALHEHNERRQTPELIARLQAGASVALVSDAGTPAISDPGALLVAAAAQAGIAVCPIPGANAAVAALSVAGLQSDRFLFYGFLPAKASARRRELAALSALPYALVFYEAPHRVLECVDDLAAVLGAERECVIARELTKVYESIHRCRLGTAREWLQGDANRQRGEFVLIVSGADAAPEPDLSPESERALRVLLAELPLARAVTLAAEITGARRNALYARALQWRAANGK